MHPTMDLRSQENELKPSSSSSHFPPLSNDSYFTQQALRAGLMINDEIRRTEFMRNSDPLREAIVIELEKEKIIQEIMVAEIIRKRALEAEIRREIAMGRDLAVQRDMEFPWSSSMLPEPKAPILHHHLRHRPNDSGFEERFSFPTAPDGKFTFSELARE